MSRAPLERIVLAAIFIVLAGCEASGKFQRGQMVKTVIGGHVGQVIHKDCAPRMCFYDVRFGALEIRTDTHILAADGAIQFAPISVVRGMREFELVAK